MFQIELYNSMVEKEGTDGEKDAIKAYRAAREEIDNADEVAEGDEVSSSLIERVRIFPFQVLFFLVFFSSWYKQYQCTQHDTNYCVFFVYFRLMLCSKILKRKSMMWMPKSVIVGDYLTGL
jgi:hypothetical protein